MDGFDGMDELLPGFYDVDGEPLTAREWAELLQRRIDGERYGLLGRAIIGEVMVSTIWTGFDANDGLFDGPPVIFETMVFGGRLDLECERYATKADALDGHARWVAAVDQATAQELAR